MAVREHGYIKALNIETGAEWEIRPDMLLQSNHPWRVLDKEHLGLPGAMRNQEPSTEAPKASSLKAKKNYSEPKVIMTSKGKPFATDIAAKAAMSRKGLSEHEWLVLPNGNNGFIISKL